MRYGRLRRGSCHGAGLGGVVPRDADALCEQEEHAAPRETKEACAQAVEDRRHFLSPFYPNEVPAGIPCSALCCPDIS